jgi:hypothetical protein
MNKQKSIAPVRCSAWLGQLLGDTLIKSVHEFGESLHKRNAGFGIKTLPCRASIFLFVCLIIGEHPAQAKPLSGGDKILDSVRGCGHGLDALLEKSVLLRIDQGILLATERIKAGLLRGQDGEELILGLTDMVGESRRQVQRWPTHPTTIPMPPATEYFIKSGRNSGIIFFSLAFLVDGGRVNYGCAIGLT